LKTKRGKRKRLKRKEEGSLDNMFQVAARQERWGHGRKGRQKGGKDHAIRGGGKNKKNARWCVPIIAFPGRKRKRKGRQGTWGITIMAAMTDSFRRGKRNGYSPGPVFRVSPNYSVTEIGGRSHLWVTPGEREGRTGGGCIGIRA